MSDLDALLDADRRFAEATRERGVDGWVAWFAPDGCMLTPAGGATRGAEAIRELMAENLADPERRLAWEPVHGELSADATFGFTYGRWWIPEPDNADGEPAARGKYMSVWEREPGGEWRVRADLGYRDAPDEPALT